MERSSEVFGDRVYLINREFICPAWTTNFHPGNNLLKHLGRKGFFNLPVLYGCTCSAVLEHVVYAVNGFYAAASVGRKSGLQGSEIASAFHLRVFSTVQSQNRAMHFIQQRQEPTTNRAHSDGVSCSACFTHSAGRNKNSRSSYQRNGSSGCDSGRFVDYFAKYPPVLLESLYSIRLASASILA